MNKKTRLMALALLLFYVAGGLSACKKWREVGEEFNNIFRDFKDKIEQQSKEWQALVKEQSGVWADLIDLNSQEWQDLVKDESKEWREFVGQKSDEWIAVADSFRAIARDFQHTADDFVATINNINDDMPAHIQLAITDLNKAMNNAVGTALANFLCASDILEGKAMSWLEFIKDELGIRSSNTFYRPQDILDKPTICSSDLASINLALPQNRWEEVAFFGYGFDEFYESIEVVFTNERGGLHTSDQQILFKNSNYKLVLILNGMDIRQLRLFDKLSLTHDQELLTELPIIN